MRDKLQKAIFALTDELDEIRCDIQTKEEEIIKLKAIGYTDENSDRIDNLNESIKNELQRNIDTLNLQLEISKYIKKYIDLIEHSSEAIEQEKEKQKNNEGCYLYIDILKKTESGELPYDENHPLYGDCEFINEFIEFLVEKENFELCEKFKSIKENLLREDN